FVRSLTGVAERTRRAYAADVTQFVRWAERGGCPGPEAIDRRVLRRYLAYLDTRRFAPSTIARKAAAMRSYLRFLRRRGVVDDDPGSTMRAPRRAHRLPRVVRRDEASALIDAAADVAGRAPGGIDTAPDTDVAVALRDLAVLEVLYGAGLR